MLALKEKSIGSCKTTKHAIRKKHSSSSHGQTTNTEEYNISHKRNSDRTSSGTMPGAVLVQGTSSPTFRTSDEVDSIVEPEGNNTDEVPSLIIPAELVNHDEEANLVGDSILERMIEEEVESRLLRHHQNNAVLAEPMDSVKPSIGADTTLKSESTDNVGHGDKMLFGLKQKIWYTVVGMAILVVGLVAGVVASSKEQGAF